MVAITKSPTKDKIDKYILALIIVQYSSLLISRESRDLIPRVR